MAKPTKKQLEAMKKLGMTDEEIAQVIADDEAIERGEKREFDLTPEQLKEAKKYTKAGTKKPTVYKLDNENGKRSRKENPTKAAIIAEIAEFLQKNSENAVENLVVLNKERQISFQIGENTYEITLTQKRKPKK
jgi:hypothetical protein